MNALSTVIGIVGGIIGLLGLLSFMIVYSKGSVAKETIELYKDNNEALEKRVKILEDSDIHKSKRIAELEGEIKTIKDIPLEELSKSYKVMAETVAQVATVQEEILKLFKERG